MCQLTELPATIWALYVYQTISHGYQQRGLTYINWQFWVISESLTHKTARIEDRGVVLKKEVGGRNDEVGERQALDYTKPQQKLP